MSFTFVLPLTLGGCAMSLFGGGTPQTTGSIVPPVDVQQPLPSTLAYSDATKIGEAARAALGQVNGAASGDWINNATGSSGTVEAVALDAAAEPGSCRAFSTTVTSVGGVHQYSGALCGNFGTTPRLRIDERNPADRT